MEKQPSSCTILGRPLSFRFPKNQRLPGSRPLFSSNLALIRVSLAPMHLPTLAAGQATGIVRFIDHTTFQETRSGPPTRLGENSIRGL